MIDLHSCYHMPRPLKMDPDQSCIYGESDCPTSLERLLKLEETTDVTLVGADGKNPRRAHKAVLASASDFFMSMFFGEGRRNWEENAKGVVTLKEFSSEAVRMIVNVVYTGRVEISPDQSCQPLPALELIGASDFFNMPQLNRVCRYFLRRHGRKIVQSELQNVSMPVLCKVLASDALGCEEIAIFKAVEQWIEARKASLGEDDIKEILSMVRYGVIPAKELVSVVGPSKWKDEALFLAALDNWIEPDVSKPKVPQHLARANTFPLLPFATSALNVTVKEGTYSYQVISPLQHGLDNTLASTAGLLQIGPPTPTAGVLLAVDNLEMPVIVSSQLPSLYFSFGVLPETNEQAIAFSHFSCLGPTQTLTSTTTVGNQQGLCLGHPLGTGLRAFRETEPIVQLPSISLSSASSVRDNSKFVISKEKDAIVITQDTPKWKSLRHDVCSTTKHILIGVQVAESATLKQVPSS